MAAPSSAPRRSRRADLVLYALVLLAALSCLAELQLIFAVAPVEATMGVVQKIFYFHVPAAYGMYCGAAVCLVGSALYLGRGTPVWDALARAGAEVAVAMGLMVMISGPLWAAKAWGRYWVWEPRLTTALLGLLIYVAYVLLRQFAGGGEAERRFGAALGVLGAANLPIVHLAVRKWGGQHPAVIAGGGGGLQHWGMKLALAGGLVTFTLLCAVLIWHRARIHLTELRLAALEQERLALAEGED